MNGPDWEEFRVFDHCVVCGDPTEGRELFVFGDTISITRDGRGYWKWPPACEDNPVSMCGVTCHRECAMHYLDGLFAQASVEGTQVEF